MLKSMPDDYFQGGRWTLPYLGAYLTLWAFKVDPAHLLPVFWALHLTNLVLALSAWRKDSFRVDWFWLGLALLFFVPGAYLEYPADPWEHFRRIFEWQRVDQIGHHSNWKKFVYFWDYSVIFWLEPGRRRVGLGVINAFWQLLVAWQWFLLSLRLGMDRTWSRVSVIAFLATFGSNVFGLRYYALSSTPLALVACWGALDILLRPSGERARALPWLPLLLGVMALNHSQTVGFFALLATGLFLGENFAASSRPRVWIAGAIGATLVSGLLLRWFLPGIYNNIGGVGNVTAIGILELAKTDFRIKETLGVMGALGLLSALWISRREPRIAALTWAPLLCLLFPPSAALLAKLFRGPEFMARLLFAFPVAMALTAGFRRAGLAPKAALIVVVIFGALPWYPFRGRLWFQVYQPPTLRSYLPVDELAQWIVDYGKRYPKTGAEWRRCRFVSDHVTSFILATHFGWLPTRDRGVDDPEIDALQNHRNLTELAAREPICGYVSPIETWMPEIPRSPVADLSGHWKQERGDMAAYSFRTFHAATETLLTQKGQGWKAISLPPFYYLVSRNLIGD